MNISEFKKGDVITRTKKVGNLALDNLIGKEITFLGIANGVIYTKVKSDHIVFLFGTNIGIGMNLIFEDSEDGWEKYVSPDSFYEMTEEGEVPEEISIEDQIKEALRNEDYEKAALLKGNKD